jgi:hypothetical protein
MDHILTIIIIIIIIIIITPVIPIIIITIIIIIAIAKSRYRMLSIPATCFGGSTFKYRLAHRLYQLRYFLRFSTARSNKCWAHGQLCQYCSR